MLTRHRNGDPHGEGAARSRKQQVPGELLAVLWGWRLQCDRAGQSSSSASGDVYCKAESLEYLPKGRPPPLGSCLPVRKQVSPARSFARAFLVCLYPFLLSRTHQHFPSLNHPNQFYVIKSSVGVGLRACWWHCTAGREMPWGRGSVRAPLSQVWWPSRGTRCMTWAPFHIDYEVPKECQH